MQSGGISYQTALELLSKARLANLSATTLHLLGSKLISTSVMALVHNCCIYINLKRTNLSSVHRSIRYYVLTIKVMDRLSAST